MVLLIFQEQLMVLFGQLFNKGKFLDEIEEIYKKLKDSLMTDFI